MKALTLDRIVNARTPHDLPHRQYHLAIINTTFHFKHVIYGVEESNVFAHWINSDSLDRNWKHLLTTIPCL